MSEGNIVVIYDGPDACPRCLGWKRVANSDDGESWKYWAELARRRIWQWSLDWLGQSYAPLAKEQANWQTTVAIRANPHTAQRRAGAAERSGLRRRG